MVDEEPKGAPLIEERLRAVTIGKMVPLNTTIDLAPYNPQWPSLYARLEAPGRGNPPAQDHNP
jgi:hypothetical protein